MYFAGIDLQYVQAACDPTNKQVVFMLHANKMSFSLSRITDRT